MEFNPSAWLQVNSSKSSWEGRDRFMGLRFLPPADGTLQVGFVSLVSSSEGLKLYLKDEAEEMLCLSAGCLASHSSAFIANSHFNLAESLAANNVKQKVLFDRQKCMLIQV